MIKTCSKCRKIKEVSEFPKDNHAKCGYKSHCKQCKNAENRDYRRNHPEIRLKALKERQGIKFDISVEYYKKLLISQNNKCAICGKKQSEFKHSFTVDHNHITGEIRGLLCFNCNFLLGHAKDSIKMLKSAINYLNKYQQSIIEF